MALGSNVTRSAIGIRAVGYPGGSHYPVLQEHPRRGTPKRGPADERPEGGGEFFRSRGIGIENTSCFCCLSRTPNLRANIAAFVRCKAAGERVVALFFARGARLDYRPNEPHWIQVNVGACEEHRPNLERLHALVADGIITEEKIAVARRHSADPRS